MRNIRIYALSTCGWCHRTIKWLEEKNVECKVVYVDKLSGKERDEAAEAVKKHNPNYSFPTTVIDEGEAVVVGFKPDVLEKEIKK